MRLLPLALLFCSTSLLAAPPTHSTATASSARAEPKPTGCWAANSKGAPPGPFMLADSTGSNDFLCEDGVSLVRTAGTYVVAFDGSQAKSATAAQKLPVPGALTFSIEVNPSGVGDERQSIVVAWGVFDLRFIPASSEYTLSAWLGRAGPYKTISLPGKPGEWASIRGRVDGRNLRLEVDGKSVTGTIVGQPVPAEPAVTLMLGGSGKERRFTGMLNNLCITTGLPSEG